MTLAALKSRLFLTGLSCVWAAASAGCDASEKSRRTELFGTVSVTTSADAKYVLPSTGVFYRVADEPAQGQCFIKATTTQCRVWECEDSVYTESLPEYKTIVPGGVHIMNGARRVDFDVDERGYFEINDAPVPWWKEGDKLGLYVDGATDFPPTDVTLDAPDPVVVTSPVPPEAPEPEEEGADEEGADGDTETETETEPLPLLIDRSANFPVRWSSPRSGGVFVIVSPETRASDGAEPRVTPGIDCGFPAGDGEGEVPAEVLAALPKPENLTRYVLDVVNFSYDATLTHNARLEFRATWIGLTTPVEFE